MLATNNNLYTLVQCSCWEEEYNDYEYSAIYVGWKIGSQKYFGPKLQGGVFIFSTYVL